MPHHFLTIDTDGERARTSGYEQRGVIGYVYPSQHQGTVPIYRFWNPKNGDSFYTQQHSGERALQAGYIREPNEVGWYMFAEPSKEVPTVALNHWWNKDRVENLYTTDSGKELASKGYVFEGVLGFVTPKGQEGPGAVALNEWFKA